MTPTLSTFGFLSLSRPSLPLCLSVSNLSVRKSSGQPETPPKPVQSPSPSLLAGLRRLREDTAEVFSNLRLTKKSRTVSLARTRKMIQTIFRSRRTRPDAVPSSPILLAKKPPNIYPTKFPHSQIPSQTSSPTLNSPKRPLRKKTLLKSVEVPRKKSSAKKNRLLQS